MPRENYHVLLSTDQEQRLKDIPHKGNSFSAKEILHANILLLTNKIVHKKRCNQEIADIFGISKATVNQLRKIYALHGIDAAIGEILNINELRPHLSKYWCIPQLNDDAYVANMEDVLSIYETPYNPEVPVICMDEKPIQLLGEIWERIQARPIHLAPDSELPNLGIAKKQILNMLDAVLQVFLCLQNLQEDGGILSHQTTGQKEILY